MAIRPGRQGNPQGTRLSRLLESHAMGLLRSCPGLLFAVLLLSVQSLAAQNFEFGGHAGVAILGSEGPTLSPDTNVGAEFGLWVVLWPSSKWAIAADWAYVPRDDFHLDLEPFPVGETKRNRQYVDITLQYHFTEVPLFSPFLEVGGGAHWNNREVINPGGAPGFEEAGKESSRFAVWTIGGGIRKRIAPLSELDCRDESP